MTVFQSIAISSRRDAEHGDLAAVGHVGEHVAEGRGVAGHLQADVEAFLHAQLASARRRASRCATSTAQRRRPSCCASSSRYGLTSVIDDVARARRGWTTAAAMMPIGPAPVISTSSPSTSKRQRGVHGVAERVEDRRRRRGRCSCRDARRWSSGSAMYSANAPGRLTPMPLRVRAQMPPAGQAVAAAAADDVPLAADDVAGREVVDVGADLDDLADELVADHHRHRDRLLRPGVPVVDVHVGAADAGAQSTRISTSLMPISGSGTSSSHSPGSAWALTSARIERRSGLLVGPARVDDTAFASAVEIAALVRSGGASAREVVEAALRRIEALDPALNAFIEVDGERALAAADAVKPGDAQPFAGVPIAIKGNVPVEGCALNYGSRFLDGHRARPLRVPRAAAARGGLRDRRHRPTCPSSRSCRRPSRASPAPRATRGTSTRTPGGLQRRLGGGGRGRDGAARARQRRRRLDPHPRRVLRARRAQAEPRAGLGRAGPRRVVAGLPRRAHPHGGRHRARARRARRLRGRRRELGAAARRALRDRDAARPRPAADRRHRRQPARRGAAAGRDRRPARRRRDAARRSATRSWRPRPPFPPAEVLEIFINVFGPAIALGIDSACGMRGREPGEDEIEPLSRALLERARADARRSPTWARSPSCRRSRAASSAFFADYDVLVTPALGERPLPIGECHGLGERPAARPRPLRRLHALHVAVQRHRPARDLGAGRARRRRPARPACRSSAGRSTRTCCCSSRGSWKTAHPWAHLRPEPAAIRRGVTPSASASAVPRALKHLDREQLRLVPGDQRGRAGERLLGAQRGAQAGERERQRAPAAARRGEHEPHDLALRERLRPGELVAAWPSGGASSAASTQSAMSSAQIGCVRAIPRPTSGTAGR